MKSVVSLGLHLREHCQFLTFVKKTVLGKELLKNGGNASNAES
jgi:hypothetical protein